MSTIQKINLPGGEFMPIIGFGTWKIQTEDTIYKAVKAGYRHIDTAHMYNNECEIGNVLSMLFQEGVVKREDLFIVSKLPRHAHYREKVTEILKESLENLRLSYVDLYLIHFPIATLENAGNPSWASDNNADLVDTWKGMEDAKNQGLTKAIGLSNFNSKQITRILKNCTIKPGNLQVECHAYLQQRKLYDFCQDNNITFTAYSPLGKQGSLINRNEKSKPVLLHDEQVKAVADKHKKTSAQVLLRFLVQLGITVIPKSANEGRMKENFQLFDFSLDDEDMATMKSLDRGLRYITMSEVPGVTDYPQYPFKEEF